MTVEPSLAFATDSARDHARDPLAGLLLTLGFGGSVLMWAIAYAGLAPGLGAPVWGVVGVLGVVPLAGGVAAARRAGIMMALKLGLALTGINFLIVASLQGGDAPASAIRDAMLWILGFGVVVTGLCLVGGVFGRVLSREGLRPASWSSRFALIVAITTLTLLITGGVVTGLEAGMAVPGWLTTFDYPMMFYPMVKMQERYDVYAEHFHRLWGLLVGLSVLVLAVHVHLVDRRRWLRRLALLVLLGVIVQGVLGGTRVTENNLALAIAHGVFGQLVFAAIVAIAAFTSTTWKIASISGHEQAGADRRLTLVLPILLTTQLVFGALYRHLNAELGMDGMGAQGLLFLHIVMACVVAVTVVLASGRAWGVHGQRPVLGRLGKALVGLTALQLLLGGGAMVVVMMRRGVGDIPALEVALTTCHQTVGALLLAMSILLALWTRRLLVVGTSAEAA